MANFNIISWFDKSTIKHLRLLFSFHLMPVFLFALSQTTSVNWQHAAITFIILHFFIYPASNGYNSYQDKDETSIGGLKNPPKVSMNLFYATLLLDFIGIMGAFIVNVWFSIFVLIYVLISRAYSFRGLRLKKHAIVGFLTVFIFQGGFTFLMASSGVCNFSIDTFFNRNAIICMCVASLFIGSVYPLTQIYQHQADEKDGVTTISFKLGYIGVDFVVDPILGPLILELNARPGLNIQLANREGLLPRLNLIDSFAIPSESCSWEERLAFSRKMLQKIHSHEIIP